MRKLLIICLLLIAAAGLVYAQQARNADSTYTGKTNYASLSVQGLEVTGNPGYIELRSTRADGTDTNFYLWVDSTGDLMIASRATLAAYSSFPDGTWLGISGTVVGSQS